MEHWKKSFNPLWLGEWDFEPGKDLVAKVVKVDHEMITSQNGTKEEKLVMHFEGLKPLILNSTNCKNCSKAMNSPYIEDWASTKDQDRYVQLYITQVAAFGTMTNAVRIRDFAPTVTQ